MNIIKNEELKQNQGIYFQKKGEPNAETTHVAIILMLHKPLS